MCLSKKTKKNHWVHIFYSAIILSKKKKYLDEFVYNSKKLLKNMLKLCCIYKKEKTDKNIIVALFKKRMCIILKNI